MELLCTSSTMHMFSSKIKNTRCRVFFGQPPPRERLYDRVGGNKSVILVCIRWLYVQKAYRIRNDQIYSKYKIPVKIHCGKIFI